MDYDPSKEAAAALREAQSLIEVAMGRLNYFGTHGLWQVKDYLERLTKKLEAGDKAAARLLTVVDRKEAGRIMGLKKSAAKNQGAAEARAALAQKKARPNKRREMPLRRILPD